MLERCNRQEIRLLKIWIPPCGCAMGVVSLRHSLSQKWPDCENITPRPAFIDGASVVPTGVS
jgi:hypothetical protein